MNLNNYQQLILQIIIYIFFSVFVFSTVEVIKGLYKSVAQGILKNRLVYQKHKISKHSIRLMNFIIAYIYAWAFNFQFVNNVLNLSNTKSVKTMSNHMNYFIVSAMIYVGAKKIWQTYYSKNKQILIELNEAKKIIKE